MRGALGGLLVGVALAVQGGDLLSGPPSPFDREVVLELAPEDPALLDGRGPTQVVEHTAEFEGTLHVWASSALDLALRVDDASDGRALDDDDTSDGGITPYVRIAVTEGQRLAVLVAGPRELPPAEEAPRAVRLHLVAAPETPDTREAAAGAWRAIDEAARLQSAGDFDGARSTLAAVLNDVTPVPGASWSQEVADALWDLGGAANEIGLTELCFETWLGAQRHFERTLPEDHAGSLAGRGNLAFAADVLGRQELALELRRSALEVCERARPADDPELQEARYSLAVSLFNTGDVAGAQALLQSIVDAYERTGSEDELLQTVRSALAASLHVTGETARALGLLEPVVAAYERTRPANDRELLEARENLAVMLEHVGEDGRARVLREQVLAVLERTLPDDHPRLLGVRGNLAVALAKTGEHERARALREAVLEATERVLPPDHADVLRARGHLADSLAKTGDAAGARALRESVLEAFERTLPRDHPELLVAREVLADSLRELGDLRGELALRHAVLEGRERTLPPDHPDVLDARAKLAQALAALGDRAGAIAILEEVLSAREHTLAPGHEDLVAAREDLAMSLFDAGELDRARELRESVLADRERVLPPGHDDLVVARLNLADSVEAAGDLVRARDMRAAALETCERTLSADHPRVLEAREALAGSLDLLGDLEGARALREAVLETRERTLPPDHHDLLTARSNLAISLHQLGDLAGARALRESALAGLERTLPADHPFVLGARENLANSMDAEGDVAGARALREAVLEVRERQLSADHSDVRRTRANLAASLYGAGDADGARRLYEELVATESRLLPADHPDLLSARTNLGVAMLETGDAEGACRLQREVLEAYERSLPADHPNVHRARWNLAAALGAAGRRSEARPLREAVLAAYERLLPRDHPERLQALASVAVLQAEEGDLEAVRDRLRELCRDVRDRVLGSLALAPREARRTVDAEADRLARAWFLDELSGGELRPAVFELAETMRLVTGEAARSLERFDADPELAPILEQAAVVRRAIHDLVVGAAGGGGESISAELTRLSLERDRLERDASRRLAERGVVARPIEVGALAAALGPDEAAVGFRRLPGLYLDESDGEVHEGPERLFAHVLRSGGALERVDLGPAAELEELATAWRAALGAPLLRGFATVEEENPEAEAGARLRERLLDPVLAVLAAAGDGVRRVTVCADDLVFLVPLDALPFDGDGAERVGDRLSVRNEVSFAPLVAPQPADEGDEGERGEPTLLAFGGVDYDAPGAAPGVRIASAAPIDTGDAGGAGDGSDRGGEPEAAGSTRGSRGALPVRFAKLRQSLYEAEATADLFEEAFELEPTLLTREETTKAALFEAAPGKRFVHLATHGWFAPESVRSSDNAGRAGGAEMLAGVARMGVEERVVGFAPMTLCGLALAGANGGRDAHGGVPGLLTAEELCSLDLGSCELAVLSACETNVGIRRAGQGIQSLQAALYAAGANSSITSLWKVDDAATRRLFEVFYTKLWEEGLPKAEALWQAKRALRDEGAPVRDWAAWVLSGDPD